MVELSGISPEKKVNAISREERHSFVSLMKDFVMTLTRTRDYREAIITKGGVDVKEIDPGTMGSKLVKNLYFAGEVLDPVSYTHLIISLFGLIPAITKKFRKNAKTETVTTAEQTSSAVSYTHLDVYKRQVVYSIGEEKIGEFNITATETVEKRSMRWSVG